MTLTLSVEAQQFLLGVVYVLCIFGCWCVFVYALAEMMGKWEEWIAEDMNDSEVDI